MKTTQNPQFLYETTQSIFVYPILTTVALGCCIIIFILIVSIGWVEPMIVLVFVGIGTTSFFALASVKTLKRGFRSLSIDDSQISLKTFSGKTIHILRNDIHRIEWHENKVTISTIDNRLDVSIDVLPEKSKIGFLYILSTWSPLASLPIEMQSVIEEIKKLALEAPPNLKKPFQISADPENTVKDVLLRKGEFLVPFILLIIVVRLFGFSLLEFFSSGFGVMILIFILMTIIVTGIELWNGLSKQVEISNEGIDYRVGFRKKSFVWESIEAIALRPHQGDMRIWLEDGQTINIRLVGLRLEQLVVFEETLVRQIHSHRIPAYYTP